MCVMKNSVEKDQILKKLSRHQAKVGGLKHYIHPWQN